MNLNDLKYRRGSLTSKLLLSCIVFFVGLLLAGSLAVLIGEFFPTDSRAGFLSQSIIQNLVAFCGTAIVTAYFVSPRPMAFLGMSEKCGIKPFLGVLIVFILGMPFMNQLIYYNSIMRLPEAFSGFEGQLRSMEEANGRIAEILLSSTSVWGLVSGILFVGILTGLGEEMMFRGTLQNIMAKNSRLGSVSIWLAAFIFSAVHLQFYGFFPRLLLGAFFGYLLYSTGSLWPGVFAHALNNSLVVVATWLSNRGVDDMAFDSIGVVEHGFPTPGVRSLIALVLFFIFGYRYFFSSQNTASQHGCSKD